MVLKIIHVILLASVKYILTLPYALIIGLEYEQAIIAVLTGGIGGFLFFYYLSKLFIRAIDVLWPALQILYNLSEKEPGLKPELLAVIEHVNELHPSPGIRSRSRKLAKKLESRLQKTNQGDL